MEMDENSNEEQEQEDMEEDFDHIQFRSMLDLHQDSNMPQNLSYR
jgi:hypothetical protein